MKTLLGVGYLVGMMGGIAWFSFNQGWAAAESEVERCSRMCQLQAEHQIGFRDATEPGGCTCLAPLPDRCTPRVMGDP